MEELIQLVGLSAPLNKSHTISTCCQEKEDQLKCPRLYLHVYKLMIFCCIKCVYLCVFVFVMCIFGDSSLEYITQITHSKFILDSNAINSTNMTEVLPNVLLICSVLIYILCPLCVYLILYLRGSLNYTPGSLFYTFTITLWSLLSLQKGSLMRVISKYELETHTSYSKSSCQVQVY